MKTELITPKEWRAPLAGYLAWLAINRPASTQYQRSYHLRRYAVRTGLSPRATTHDDLIAYLGSQGWGDSTKHVARSTFRSFYFWAHRVAKIVEENPADLLPVIRPAQGEPRPASEFIVVDAIHIADERIALMMRLGAQLGLRCCEIAKVHTGDLRRDLSGDWELRVVGKGKRKRTLPLPDQLARELLEREPGYLFPGQIDGHLSPAYVSKLISRALPAGVTAHMLRHRFASIAYSEERDIRNVQMLLGHRNVSTTEVYTAVPKGAMRRAVERAAA